VKKVLLTIALLILPVAACAAIDGGELHVRTVHSQNGRFYLRSISFDSMVPSALGVTRVYSTDQSEPLYEFERAFDSVTKQSNNLVLSDDGETIFYAVSWGALEKSEELKSIAIYRHGRIYQSYTATQINGCDKREHCSLIYDNYEQVVDREKSQSVTPYRKILKDGVSEEEKFLSDFALFCNEDLVYLTDSKRRTHVFDLKAGKLEGSSSFDEIYLTMKGLARSTQLDVESYKKPSRYDFPSLKGGGDTAKALAAYLGMKEFGDGYSEYRQYRRHEVTLSANLLRDGSVEVEDLEVDGRVPRDRILEFFRSSRFEFGDLPADFDKYHLGSLGTVTFYLRSSDKRVARSEKQAEREEDARAARGASAVLYKDWLIHLDEKNRLRMWALRDGSFDAEATARFAREGLTGLASDGKQVWAVSTREVYLLVPEGGWKIAGRLRKSKEFIKGFAAVDGMPLVIFESQIVDAVHGKTFRSPGMYPRMPSASSFQLTDLGDEESWSSGMFGLNVVAAVGTESYLWIGTSNGEWGGSLYRVNPRTGSWVSDSDCRGYVTGITKAATNEVFVSWSMSHMGPATTQICRHALKSKPQKYPELEAQYYQTVGFNPFDNILYGVEQGDVVTIKDGLATTVAEISGPVFDKEPLALGVAPGIRSLLPLGPGALVVVPKVGMPWLLRDGKLTHLTEP
jgi:hypothetical protein